MHQNATENPVEPALNAGIWTYWEEAEENSIAPVPTTLSVVLIVGLFFNTALYALPPVPRLATEVPDTVLVSKE